MLLMRITLPSEEICWQLQKLTLLAAPKSKGWKHEIRSLLGEIKILKYLKGKESVLKLRISHIFPETYLLNQ